MDKPRMNYFEEEDILHLVISDEKEAEFGTDPYNQDSDHDGVWDNIAYDNAHVKGDSGESSKPKKGSGAIGIVFLAGILLIGLLWWRFVVRRQR